MLAWARGCSVVAVAIVALLLSCGVARPPARSDIIGVAAPGLEEPSPAMLDVARPRSYRLHLDLDPAAEFFSGQVEIDLDLLRASSRLWLHAADLIIDHAELEFAGERIPLRQLKTAPWQLGLDAGRVLAPGRMLLRLGYRGVTSNDEQGLFRRVVDGRSYLFSQSQSQYARRIVPCFDEPRYKVPWQLSVTAARDVTILGNAALARGLTLPDGRHRSEFAATAPMSSYLLAIAAGPFELIDLGQVGRQHVPMRIAVPAGARSEAGMAAAQVPRVVAAVESYLDLPLPSSKLDIVAVASFFGAMENPGLITVDQASMLGAGDDPELRTSFTRLFTHEIAHQWFGNLVTPERWDDLWLSESLATWLATTGLPGLPELDGVASRVASRMAAIVADRDQPSPLVPKQIDSVENLFDPIRYDKGAAVITMFAHWLGEARMVAVLRDFLARHREGTVRTEDLAAALARVEPAAGAILRRVATHAGLPSVTLRRRCGDRPAIVVALARSAGPIPVCVRIAEGQSSRAICQVMKTDGEVALPPGTCPAWISGNDDLRGYYGVRWLDAGQEAQMLPMAVQTRAERLGLGWEVAIDIARGSPRSGAAVVALLSRSDAEPRSPASVELDLADLQLIAAIEPLVGDADLEIWHQVVAGRMAPMFQPVLAPASELERQRASAMLDVLTDVVWPIAVTREAHSRLRNPVQRGSETLRLWRTAVRSGQPAAVTELLQRVTHSPRDTDPWTRRALPWLPATALPSLFAAIDHATLSWSEAVPVLTAMLQRRAAQTAVVAALEARAAIWQRALAPVEMWQLLGAMAALCTVEHRAGVETLFGAVAATNPEGERIKVATLSSIEQCVMRRSVGGPGVHRTLAELAQTLLRKAKTAQRSSLNK
jgi:Peptidase family M1 domain/Peptidase M1 N-terminal domain